MIPQTHFEKVLFAIFLLTLPLLNPWVRGDGVGYYAYARAPLIEHSLDFTHDYQSANDSFREGRFDENGQIKSKYYTRTGHLDNHFTVGPALLWSPALLVVHGSLLVARSLGSKVPADGFSAPYRWAMALATALYAFLALLLSFRLASKFVAPIWSFIATVAIWWASSLPVYTYFNPSWSHAHSAFMVALFVWYWNRTREHRGARQWVILAVITGIMLDVYYANLMVVSILAVEAFRQYRGILQSRLVSCPSFAELIRHHVIFVLVVWIMLIPTFVSRWIVYGGFFDTGYISIRDFLWRSPVFLSVLFSSDHGLLSWTPLLVFAILGLLLFAFRVPDAGIPFFVALVAFYSFISVYPDWAGISSYGNRFFVSLTSLFVLGLSFFLDRIAQFFPSRRTVVATASAGLAVFVLWNFGLMYQWGLHLIPVRGPVSFSLVMRNQLFVVPKQLTKSLSRYVLHRKALMNEIEDRDLQQLHPTQ